MRVTASDVELLRRIAAEAVTWSETGIGRRSYRLWSSETEYTLCTRRAVRLIEAGHAKHDFAGGYHYGAAGRGPLVLTPAGQQAIDGAPT